MEDLVRDGDATGVPQARWCAVLFFFAGVVGVPMGEAPMGLSLEL